MQKTEVGAVPSSGGMGITIESLFRKVSKEARRHDEIKDFWQAY